MVCARCRSTNTQAMLDGHHCLECNHTTTRTGKTRKGA